MSLSFLYHFTLRQKEAQKWTQKFFNLFQVRTRVGWVGSKRDLTRSPAVTTAKFWGICSLIFSKNLKMIHSTKKKFFYINFLNDKDTV